MKRRLYRWMRSKMISYIPSTNKLYEVEAKRLAEFIIENYTEHQQWLVLDSLKENLVKYRESQIEDSITLIENTSKKIESLKHNLQKLTNET